MNCARGRESPESSAHGRSDRRVLKRRRRIHCECGRAQPPFVPRPMFLNPESGHERGRSAGRSTPVTLIGRTSIVGTLSATRGCVVFLPRTVAANTSPQLKSSRPAAAIVDGARMTTSAHASSHPGTTTVRVIVILLRYYQRGKGRVHNGTDLCFRFPDRRATLAELARSSLLKARKVREWARCCRGALCNVRHRLSSVRETLLVGVSEMLRTNSSEQRGGAHQRRRVRLRSRIARFWRSLFRPSRSFIGWQPVTIQPTQR